MQQELHHFLSNNIRHYHSMNCLPTSINYYHSLEEIKSCKFWFPLFEILLELLIKLKRLRRQILYENLETFFQILFISKRVAENDETIYTTAKLTHIVSHATNHI